MKRSSEVTPPPTPPIHPSGMGQFVAAKAEVLSVAFNRNVPCLSSYYLPQFDMLDCDSSGALVYRVPLIGGPQVA